MTSFTGSRPCFFNNVALEKISQGAEAGYGDSLAAQIFRLSYVWPDEQFALHAGYSMCHRHEIRAAQIGAHDRRQCAWRAEDAVADNRLRRLSRTAQQHQLGLHAILSHKAWLPWRSMGSTATPKATSLPSGIFSAASLGLGDRRSEQQGADGQHKATSTRFAESFFLRFSLSPSLPGAFLNIVQPRRVVAHQFTQLDVT